MQPPYVTGYYYVRGLLVPYLVPVRVQDVTYVWKKETQVT